MRWLTYILTAGAVLVAQVAFAPRFELLGLRPDWLLVFVVFVSLRANRYDAVAGAWILGCCADLFTIEQFGLMSLSYGLAALLVTLGRDALFARSLFTQTTVTFVVGLLLRIGWLIYRSMAYGLVESIFAHLVADVLLPSFYTALWVVLLFRPIAATARWLGLASSRRRSSSPRRTRASYV
jgi:rod shape-determining protein MreD